MNFYGENARGCICVPLDAGRPDLVAQRYEIMLAIYAAGFDLPIQYVAIEKNGMVTAYAWQEATYGVLRLFRRGTSSAWQVEVRGDFSKPYPQEQDKRTRR